MNGDLIFEVFSPAVTQFTSFSSPCTVHIGIIRPHGGHIHPTPLKEQIGVPDKCFFLDPDNTYKELPGGNFYHGPVHFHVRPEEIS
jgi:hypothetical protein